MNIVNHKLKIVNALLLMLAMVGTCQCANIYVNHDGNSTSPYDTEAKASTDIQVALDAAKSGDTILIKADQNYKMNGADQQAAQFDVDVNSNVAIKGYYSTVGDQDYGGAYYKNSTNGWVIIDANNGAYNVFSTGDFNNLRWHNLKTINVNTSYIAYDLTPIAGRFNYMVQNCIATGGKYAIYADYVGNIIVRDCTFTGTYPGISGTVIKLYANCFQGSIIQDCNFAHGAAKQSIMCQNIGMNIIYNNIFNISGTTISAVNVSYAGFVVNNTIYEGTGGTITNGVKIETMGRGTVIYNNIIVGCTTSISDAATINFGGWNCLYNNGSNWTLRDGDITTDPQFMDTANGDFRLKPTSPCLNTGKPTMNGGYTDMGAWQRKSLLRIEQ